MKVVIGHSLSLEETDDLRRLSAISQLPLEAIPSVMDESGAGIYASDHCWLKVTVLRELGPDEDKWLRSFDEMIACAASHGWVAGDWVRVHFES